MTALLGGAPRGRVAAPRAGDHFDDDGALREGEVGEALRGLLAALVARGGEGREGMPAA